MRLACLILLLCASCANADLPVLKLKPIEGNERNYGTQLIEKFNALLKSNDSIKADFDEFEQAIVKEVGGRYLGFSASPLMLHRWVDQTDRKYVEKHTRAYHQKLVIYYSFRIARGAGIEFKPGVFATFHLKGIHSYKPVGNGGYKISGHQVTAEFGGFSTTLNAEQISEGKGQLEKKN